jgi:hypothetical protein
MAAQSGWRDVPVRLLGEWRDLFDRSREGLDLAATCPNCGTNELHRWFALHREQPTEAFGRSWRGEGSQWQWWRGVGRQSVQPVYVRGGDGVVPGLFELPGWAQTTSFLSSTRTPTGNVRLLKLTTHIQAAKLSPFLFLNLGKPGGEGAAPGLTLR